MSTTMDLRTTTTTTTATGCAGLDGAIMLRVKLRSSANEQRLNSTPEYIIIHLIKVYSGLHPLCGEEIERPLKSFALQLSNNIL